MIYFPSVQVSVVIAKYINATATCIATEVLVPFCTMQTYFVFFAVIESFGRMFNVVCIAVYCNVIEKPTIMPRGLDLYTRFCVGFLDI